MKNNNGITLMALVITIIVLIILAGVTIGALSGENGIINKAKEAKEVQERAEMAELMDVAYVSATRDEKSNDEIMKEIATKLEEGGYVVKTKSTSQQSLESIMVGQKNVEINKSADPLEITVTLKYNNQNNNKYYVLINQKYYEILLKGNGVEISQDETDISKDEIKEEQIIEISDNDNSIVTATITKKTETEYILTITPIGVGTSSIKIKAKDTNKSEIIDVAVTNKVQLELEGEGTENNPYKISTISNWAYLAGIVNGGEHCTNTYFEFTTNVEESSSWEMMGNSQENFFDGIFDGKSHKISYMHGTSLFGYTGKNAIIKNITIESSEIQGDGGILVVYNNGTINNCVTRYCTINAEKNNIGGICGYNTGIIENCIADSDTIQVASDNVGGICGYNEGTINNCDTNACTIYTQKNNVGGIVGYNNGSIIKCNLKNYTKIEGISNKGDIAGSCGEKSDIKDCTADNT